jgi:ElaB/YqjD/DUF883 family membrane-anchored ribosome-binding protein
VTKALENRRTRAATSIQNAAAGLHRAADRSRGARMSRFTHAAADKLGATANYVRDHEFRQMVGDVEKYAKANPGKALAVAAIAGFLAGVAIRRAASARRTAA